MKILKSLVDRPVLIKGDTATDTRGIVSFVNDFKFPGIKRFYVVSNHKIGTVRAWHGHKKESKFVFAIAGEAQIGAVRIDDWKNPSKKSKVNKFLISSNKPEILYIPKGYVNGFKSLTKDTKLIFFSDRTLEESKNDDIRFTASYWDIWD